MVEVKEESVTVSFSEVEQERVVTMVFQSNSVVTVSESLVVEQTRLAISWVIVVISHLPIYVTVSRRVVFRLEVEPDGQMDSRVSNAVLIGSSSGAAAVVVLLVIAVIAVIRARIRNEYGVSDHVDVTLNRRSFDGVAEATFEEKDAIEDPLERPENTADEDLPSEDDTMYL
jgi:FlaA1/EpsC-like NDP-sugar epimerase